MKRHFNRAKAAAVAAAGAALFLMSGMAAAADGSQVLWGHVPAIVNRSQFIRHLDTTNNLKLAISLPLRDPAGLSNLLQQIYDPASPNYHQYLTAPQFAGRFGPTVADYETLKAFAASNNLAVTGTHPNRTLLDVEGNVADIERVFHVHLQVYQDPTHTRSFYAPSTDPSVDLNVPLLHVSGLDNAVLPFPKFKIKPAPHAGQAVPRGTGSGPYGCFWGNDFRAAYAPGVTLTGTGQSVALFELDGYYASDVLEYETNTGLPNVPLVNVLVDGFSGTPASQDGDGEVTLDIDMAIAMAPGISNVFVYEGTNSPDDVLNKIATDDLSSQISCSWGWFPAGATTDQIFQQYAAQGQTFYDAAGDDGAEITPADILTPSDNPYITQVGGTTLTTTGPGGAWQSETVWSWFDIGEDAAGSGGISFTYLIPSWQQGINMTTNGGSTTYRNYPDVALTADNIFIYTDQGVQQPGTGGTSCAAPLWAGFTALVNEQAASKSEPPMGFINPAIYTLAESSQYGSTFHDITTGNDTNYNSPDEFYAYPGYDLCSGWGTPNGANLITALTSPTGNPVLAVATNIISGGNGNGVIDFDECNNLTVTLTNKSRVAATGIEAILSSTTSGAIVAQGTSTYPNIGGDGTASNQTAFVLSTEPNFVCGTPVNLTLVIKCDQGIQTNFFQLTSGTLGSPTAFTSLAPASIPATGVFVNSPVVVSGMQSAGKLTVSVYLQDSYDFGAILQLVSPSGTTVVLSDGQNLFDFDSENYGQSCDAETTFDDSAATSINSSSANPPFVGSFQPQQSLAVFNFLEGADLNGVWNLQVANDYSSSPATLECWSLNISPQVCDDGGGQCPGADVSLAMSVSPSTAFVGSNAVYNLIVSNAGPSSAQNVAIAQVLPAGATNVFVTANGVTASQSGSNLNMTLGSLSVYGTVTVPVSVTFTTNALGQSLTALVTSTARVTTSSADPNLNNNTASATVLVSVPTADLAVTMSATPASVLQEALLTYTIDVTNNGPFTADNVTLSTTLPTGANFISATASQGTVLFNGTSAQLGNIGVGTNVVVTIVVIPTITGGAEASTTAALGANSFELDPISFNNSATVFVTVGPAADLGISALASPSPVLTGAEIGYNITVSNQGPSAASTINVIQTLPTGVTIVASTFPTHTTSGNQITGTIPSLASGASVSYENIVRSPALAGNATSNLVSTFTVSGQPADPNPTNNTFTLTTLEEPPTEAVVAAGAYLVSGSANGALGTNGTYNVQLYLQNAGNIPTTNLVATLQTNASLIPAHGSNSFDYHALAVGSAPAPGGFAFTVNSSNGATVSAILALTDNSVNLGTVTFNFAMPIVQTFSNTAFIGIPASKYIPYPDSGPANPYPSTIVVSNVSGDISGVTVTVSNLFHTFPNDIGMLLVGPGTNCVLMSAVANYTTMSGPATITFSANAGQALPGPWYDLESGTYLPGDYYEGQYGTTETFANSPAPVGPYNTNLNVFADAPANGTWSLYIEDDTEGDTGAITNGWSLAFTTVTPVNQVADLAAGISASSSQVILGGLITNIWTITNNGPDAATNVYVTNILSAGLALSANVLPSGTVTIQSGSTSVFNLGNLAAGASLLVTNIVVATADGPQTNLITTISSVQDGNPGNNTASVVTTVNPPPVDLILPAISVTPNPVVLGGSLIYTVGVTNNGPDNAFNVVGTFSLTGLGFSYAVIFPSSGTSYSVSGNSLNCQLGTIPSGGSAEVTIAATAISTGFVTNVWTVTTTSDNTNLANNSVSSRVIVTIPVAVITNGTATLMSQAGPPFNGAINNNQTNTVSFSLSNIGTGATTNLVATLVANSSVRPITTSQAYAAIAPSGSAARNFIFVASGASGASVTAELSLQDGSNTNLSPVFYTFALPSTRSYTNTEAISIPYIGPASPYPSSIDVSTTGSETVSQAVATLNGFAHTWPSDVEAVLVGPSGQEVMLMEHTGLYYAVTNLTLTFTNAATESLPADSALFSGAFWPTEFAPFDTLPTVGAVPANTTNLTVFNGTDPNGVWSLYVYDDTQGNNGAITGGWTLNLTTISALPVIPTLAAAKISGSTLRLTVGGSAQLTYGIQMSTNLISWTTVATNSTTGNFIYTDSFNNAAHRFYRAFQLSP